jgi:hypothetical protein
MRAIEAKFEAQKIAFSPLSFQAMCALLDLGILRAVSDAGDEGLNCKEIAAKTGVSEYGASVLAEMALALGVFIHHQTGGVTGGKPPVEGVAKDTGTEGRSPEVRRLERGGDFPLNIEIRFVLGKTGWFLLEDELTRVNFNFVRDVCYRGAEFIGEAVKKGTPAGLSVFSDKWETIYEGLSRLPEPSKTSWFEFDHYYSDIAFPAALPIVFQGKRRHILDIGGNTAKWSIACCAFDAAVRLTIVDLPGQTAVAEKNVREAGFGDRIGVHPCNILDEKTELPRGADAVWMSQFLDCFPLEGVTSILRKIFNAVDADTDVFVLEPLIDMQRFEAASYSLQAISLYFTCMANGTSKMYHFAELNAAIGDGGFALAEAHHNLGSNAYSLLRYRKKP